MHENSAFSPIVVFDKSHPNGCGLVPSLPFKQLLNIALCPLYPLYHLVWFMCLSLLRDCEVFEVRNRIPPPVHRTVPGGVQALRECLLSWILPAHCLLILIYSLTAISFSKVPFRCFGVWGRDEDKNSICPHLITAAKTSQLNSTFPGSCLAKCLRVPLVS